MQYLISQKATFFLYFTINPQATMREILKISLKINRRKNVYGIQRTNSFLRFILYQGTFNEVINESGYLQFCPSFFIKIFVPFS